MRSWKHALLGILLILGLGYTQCTGGLFAIPYALAATENQPLLFSPASNDQFACFSEVLMSYAEEMSKDNIRERPLADPPPCDNGECRGDMTFDLHLPTERTTATSDCTIPFLITSLFPSAPTQMLILDLRADIAKRPPPSSGQLVLLRSVILRS